MKWAVVTILDSSVWSVFRSIATVNHAGVPGSKQ